MTYAALDAYLSRQMVLALADKAHDTSGPSAVIIISSGGGDDKGSNDKGSGNGCGGTTGGGGGDAICGDAGAPTPQGEGMRRLPLGAMQTLFAPLLDQARQAGSSGARGSSGALAAGSPSAIGSGSGAKPVNIPTRKTLLYENCRLLVSRTGQGV